MTAQEKLDSKTVLDTNPATGTAVATIAKRPAPPRPAGNGCALHAGH